MQVVATFAAENLESSLTIFPFLATHDPVAENIQEWKIDEGSKKNKVLSGPDWWKESF